MTHEQRHQSLGIHGLHKHESAHQIRRLSMLKSSRRFAFLILGLLLGGLVIVLGVRWLNARELHAMTQNSAQLHVSYITASPAAALKTVDLPTTLQGFEETAVYARSAGYIGKWYKDIGDHVKAGELLATIVAPESDHELAQAQATLELARTAYERWRVMRQKDAVSQQDLDEHTTAFHAAQANVQRLEVLAQYRNVVAPFDGVITKRNIDNGSLVDAGNGGPGKMLFALSQTNTLRLYVNVPQMYAPGVKVGATAQIGLPENPEKVYAAKVVRIAGGLDAMTRTLQVEINLPNDQAHLLPGAYATVTLSLLNTHEKRLTLPTNSLLFRPDGVYVVLVQNEHAHLALVQLGSDLGARVEIVAGVEPEDQVVINPPDSILDGQSLLAQAWKTPATAVTPASAAHSPAQSPAKGG